MTRVTKLFGTSDGTEMTVTWFGYITGFDEYFICFIISLRETLKSIGDMLSLLTRPGFISLADGTCGISPDVRLLCSVCSR